MITILIQGPIRNNLYEEYLASYQSYGKVVFVCYDVENTKEIEKLFPRVTFIKIPYPSVEKTYNFNNTFLQTNGVLQGLLNIDTEFTIRVRSDESFPNLDTFIKNIKTHPDRVHVTNLYSFKDDELKFCLGNHIFAGKTKVLKDAFHWAYLACTGQIEDIYFEEGNMYINDVNGSKIQAWSEILQTISFLKAMNVEIDQANSKKIMKSNFYMTPLNDFPNFKWTHKYNGYQPITANTVMEYDPTWTNSGGEKNRFMLKIEDI